MHTDLYNTKAEKIGTVELASRLFGVAWNSRLVTQVIDAQQANARVSFAHTKNRSEVRGGGKKPYAQKHTGRARHGSRRSPLWRGGGTTFGPRNERNFSVKINKKMRQKALAMTLSKKLHDKNLFVIHGLTTEERKTKRVAEILRTFFKEKKPSVLMIPDTKEKNIFTAGRNISRVHVTHPHAVNVYDIMKHKHIMVDENAVEELARVFSHAA